MHRVKLRDYQAFMKCGSENAVFFMMGTQDLGALFAPDLIGGLRTGNVEALEVRKLVFHF